MASETTGTHEAGASALIKHRGKQNSKSELSTRLSLAVHTQIVSPAAIQHFTGAKRYVQVEAAGQMHTAATTVPLDLVPLGENIPRNTASRLTPISAQVANLGRFADEIFQGDSPPKAASIDVILQDASQINAKLQAWADSVPDLWLYYPATGIQCPVNQPRERFIYQDRMDVYEDVNIANLWNNYRTNRLTINRVILTCITRLGFPPTHEVAQSARQATQELVDAICASVPFHIGTKMHGGPQDRDDVQYPYQGGVYLSRAQRQACAAYGGWYLLDSLKPCLIVDGLREGQKGWIIGQIKRIGRLYSLQWTSHLCGPGKVGLSASEWEEEVRMACSSSSEKPAAPLCSDSDA